MKIGWDISVRLFNGLQKYWGNISWGKISSTDVSELNKIDATLFKKMPGVGKTTMKEFYELIKK